LLQCIPSLQQGLESGVGVLFAENQPNVIDVGREKFLDEREHERLAEIEFVLVRY
jgi:hypothetical protein